MYVQCDVSVADQVERTFRQVLDRFGRIDVLVNNAAVQTYGTVEETSEGHVYEFFPCFSRFHVERHIPAVPGFACQHAGLPPLKLNIYGGVRRRLAHKSPIL